MEQWSNSHCDSLRVGSPSRVRARGAPGHAALSPGRRCGVGGFFEHAVPSGPRRPCPRPPRRLGGYYAVALGDCCFMQQPFTTNCSHTKFLTDPKSKLHSVHTLTPDKLKLELRLVDQVAGPGADRAAMNFRHAAAHALVIWSFDAA